jgi:hypothetical protein
MNQNRGAQLSVKEHKPAQQYGGASKGDHSAATVKAIAGLATSLQLRRMLTCRFPESIPFTQELRGNAQCDFVWMIRAKIETNGAVELGGAFGAYAFSDKLAAQHDRFGVAPDDAEKGEVTLHQSPLDDRSVRGVSLCHAEHERMIRECRDEIGGRFVDNNAKVFRPRQLLQPFSPGVANCHGTRQGEKYWH